MIGIGTAIKTIIKNRNYNVTGLELGEGAYLITSHSCTYSSSNEY